MTGNLAPARTSGRLPAHVRDVGTPEQVSGTTHRLWVLDCNDTAHGVVGRSFQRGDSMDRPRDKVKLDGNFFGYDTLVRESTFVALEGDGKPTLQVGMQVTLFGDTKGYVPGGFKDATVAEIVGFREPWELGASDHIIEVSSGKLRAWVKPSNIKVR
jgi:hypothetical protein